MTTGVLASVANLEEAKIALDAKVDIIDLKDPSQGTLGAVSTKVAREVVQFVSGQCLVSATIGDLPMQARSIGKAIAAMGSTGVDIVKVGIFGDLTDEIMTSLQTQVINGAGILNGRQFSIVTVFFVDKDLDLEKIPALAKIRIRGVMLDTADKTHGSLRAYMRDEALQSFINQARSFGLLAGLAGSLQLGDIAALLPLKPDYLGFRGALCQGNSRVESLHSAAVKELVALF